MAIIIFYNYYLRSQRSITRKYIEEQLGLSAKNLDNDKLIITLNGYPKDDFLNNLKPFMHYGHGGIQEIKFN